MIEFELQAKVGRKVESEQSRAVCNFMADKLFPLDYKMLCKSSKNNYQLSSQFDEALIAKANREGMVNGPLSLPKDISKEYDAAFKTPHGLVIVEVEKANWEKFLYDLLKAHIYLNHGADYCCIVLPENWAHQHGEIDLFDESRKRFELARKYHCGDQRILDRIFLLGFQQYWRGSLLSSIGREKMRSECAKTYLK